jgi:hypothetical protein
MIIACRAIGAACQNRHGEIAFSISLAAKKTASESMGRTEENDVYEYSPADFERRPEAGPYGFKYSNFKMAGGSP